MFYHVRSAIHNGVNLQPHCYGAPQQWNRSFGLFILLVGDDASGTDLVTSTGRKIAVSSMFISLPPRKRSVNARKCSSTLNFKGLAGRERVGWPEGGGFPRPSCACGPVGGQPTCSLRENQGRNG